MKKQARPAEDRIEIKAFAKINLSLDVLGVLDNGYHEVSMVMQQILLCDDVLIRWAEDVKRPLPHASEAEPCTSSTEAAQQGVRISLSTNRHYLPTDERNLAYQAAVLMIRHFGAKKSGSLRIDIKKRIPVAAGLAGGSSNAAAVLHGLRKLWAPELSLKDLCRLGETLGSDIPFCIMGQAAANESLKGDFAEDPLACHCALATGTGTTLMPLNGLKSHLVLSKPSISVSTAEVYKGIDHQVIGCHPDNQAMITALAENNMETIAKNMINVLENFTLKRYSIVMYTKDKLADLCAPYPVLMSGSGPTVFGLCQNITDSKAICQRMLEENRESFWTRTTW